jgi:hypothetical protein
MEGTMTEAVPDTSAEQNTPPVEALQTLGASAVNAAEHAHDELVSVGDLARVRSRHLYWDFVDFLVEHPAGTVDQLEMPQAIHKFVVMKATEMQDAHHAASILKDTHEPFSTKVVMAHLQRFREEQQKERPSQRKAFLSSQKYKYNPVALQHADTYPEIHFITPLREDFLRKNDHKNAMIAAELLIAMGRTISAKLATPNAESN